MRTVTYVLVPGPWAREAKPELSLNHFELPTPQPGEVIYVTKGWDIGTGGTAFLERLPSGDVIKTPKPHPFLRNKHCRDMRLEALIYKKIGSHRCVPRITAWDSETCSLTMEYMANGNLRDYVRKHNETIPISLRQQWARQAADGLSAVHSAGAVHCDLSPRNFLLTDELDLKISDFGGGSLSNSTPSAICGPRFLPPGFDEDAPPSAQDDIFSLGSTIYFIMTGKYPFEEAQSDEVEKLYEANSFPDVTNIVEGDIIKGCWHKDIDTARKVFDYLEALESVQTPSSS